ncbi:MAG: SUMF1/EgtB/PvdO family nonheme iron enzyme [Desulfobulbus sp.]|nr:SUMF1/EgtB/PvdO family nonheme iron enzyme [Desulfobulbus sp.]
MVLIRFFVNMLMLLLIFATHGVCLAEAPAGNPQPLNDDVILPMPGTRTLALRPVCIGEGSGSYAWKRFRVGDPSGGYKESPTGVALGGAFRVGQSSQEDWCYYIGKYEITEDQVFAVLQAPKEYENSPFPVRDLSWFDAEDFLRKYNEWLYANAAKEVPAYGGMPGFLRLPTELEWEFAARGGSAVESAAFDRKLPYPSDQLAEYEWFSGPKSSHNKVKKIGLLKANVLGLHDMLGNVAEMTGTLYQVEYYQGRSGGYVAKGGHYLTDAAQLRSSLRTEQEFYALDNKTKSVVPAKKQTLGFRPVLSSLVFPNREVSNRMSGDWESYRQGAAQTLPAAVSTSATSTKTQVSGSDADTHLKRLKDELARGGSVAPPVQQELELLAASLADIQFTIKQAEQDSAYSWVKIGGEQAFFITKEARKLPILEKLIQSALSSGRSEIATKYREREAEIRQNIDQAMSSYTESIRQLGTVSPPAVQGGFGRYTQFLTQRNAQAQSKLLEVVRQQAEEYLKVKRTDDELWKKQLFDWSSNQQ